MREDEFERLYAAEAKGLFAFLAYRTGDRALAEDLRDHARRAAAEGRALERVEVAGEAEPDARVETLGDREELQRALATLAPEEREAIALRFGAGLTVPEMAKLLGEPLTTVEGRVYRALRKLRAELGDERP